MTEQVLDKAARHVRSDAEGRFDPAVAAVLAIGAVALAGLASQLPPNISDDRSVRRWYKMLDKPSATPPAPVFGVVWPTIGATLAFAGWRLLRAPSSGSRNAALGLLAFNVVQIPIYPALFFGGRSLTGGLASATTLVASAWAYVLAAWRADKTAALAGLPLALWTSFAEYLSVELLRRNA